MSLVRLMSCMCALLPSGLRMAHLCLQDAQQEGALDVQAPMSLSFAIYSCTLVISLVSFPQDEWCVVSHEILLAFD